MSKRQRVDEESSTGDVQLSKEFNITFNGYGSITLTKEALQLYPSSLLSQLLLSDGISEQALQVPIGRGLDYFPALIKEVFDCGAPSRIPPRGLHFDLFVKWLKYLGLATSGRSLSTESEAHKRVSFFVEVMINTLHAPSLDAKIKLPRISETETLRFVCMPPDIGRFMGDLVPFEFARRGIHVSVERRGARKLERGDLNMSRLAWYDGLNNFSLKTAEQPVFGMVAKVQSLRGVADVYKFKHDGRVYELSLSPPLGEGTFMTVELLQLDATCCYDSRDNLEFIALLGASEINLLEEFQKGGLKYNRLEHGASLISVLHENLYKNFPLQHGVRVKVPFFDKSVLANGVLLIASRPYCPPLRYCEEDGGPHTVNAGNSFEWTLSFEESPAWALESSGLPPL